MTTWEYVTVPVLVHATKQILDNWGQDGWELVQVVPGMNPENLVAYFKRPKRVSTPEERLAALGLSVPEVAAPVASYIPALRSGDHVFTSGQLPLRDGRADPHRQGGRRGHPRGGRGLRPAVRAQRPRRGGQPGAARRRCAGS